MHHNRLFMRVLTITAPITLAMGLCAHAKPNTKKDVTTKPLDKIPGGVVASHLVARTVVGENFRLWLSFNPTDCNDPLFSTRSGNDDHRFECYGQLKINGVQRWSIAKKDANARYAGAYRYDLPDPLKVNPRTQGFRLNRNPRNYSQINEFNISTSVASRASQVVHVALKLSDLDNPVFFDAEPGELNGLDRHDDVFGDFKVDIDLEKLGNSDGHYYWGWQGKDESGNAVGSNLYVFIEHVSTDYVSNSPNVQRVDPKIIEKTVPGRGPGPVIKPRRTR